MKNCWHKRSIANAAPSPSRNRQGVVRRSGAAATPDAVAAKGQRHGAVAGDSNDCALPRIGVCRQGRDAAGSAAAEGLRTSI